MSTNLTKNTIDKMNAQNKDFVVFDTSLKGFGIKVTPKERKIFIFQYRMLGKGNRTRRMTIGTYGDFINDNDQNKTLTVHLARKIAERYRGLVNANIDPATQRDKYKQTKSIKLLANEFKNSHMRTKLKKTTFSEYERAFDKYIIPKLGHRLIIDVQRNDISTFHNNMSDKPYQANRNVAILRVFFHWCIDNGHRPENSNPCTRMKMYPEKARDRYLSTNELTRLANTLDHVSDHGIETPYTIAAIRLLLLTGARRSEILKMKWDWVDLGKGTLHLPDSKTGAKLVFLSSIAIDVLKTLPRTHGNPYVIEGKIENAHLVNIQKGWQRIRTLAGLENVRIHDLRHTYASAAVMNGLSLPVVGGLLGHSQASTTQRYAHLANDHLRTANEDLGQVLKVSMKT